MSFKSKGSMVEGKSKAERCCANKFALILLTKACKSMLILLYLAGAAFAVYTSL